MAARWRERFPDDKLARAALADNAASVAGAEHDPLALELAIRTYEGLWQEAPTPTQRRALEETLETLRAGSSDCEAGSVGVGGPAPTHPAPSI